MHDVRSLRLDCREDGEATVVTAAGDIDIFTAPRLRELLLELIDAGRLQFVIDAESVTFLDSTALAVLIGTWRRVRDHGGCLALAGAPERIRQIFHVTGITRNLTLYNTTDEAVQACQAGTAGQPPIATSPHGLQLTEP